MQRYEKYKDSGIEWLGEIPEHWEVLKNKFVLRYKKGKNPTAFSDEPNENIYLSMDYLRNRGASIQYIKNITDLYSIDDGELLLLWDGANAGEFLISKKGFLSSTMAHISFNVRVNKLFGKYYSKIIERELRNSTVGMGIPHVNSSNLDNFLFIFPSILEQDTIAQFLNDKCEKIASEVGLKEQQIERLKELRQVTIHNAVTKGILHFKGEIVPMKDSRIDWIGEIPEHWEVKANRTIFVERNENGHDSLPLLSVSIHSAVSKEEIDEDLNIRGRIKIEDKSKYKLVRSEDIVFNMMRAWQGAIGQVSNDGMVSPAYIVARPIIPINSNFIEYLFRTKGYIESMNKVSKGITDFRKRLYWDQFKALNTLLPPISEQEEIVVYLEEQTSKIDKAIAQKQEQIIKLKEYKQSLINDVVTGKIKVTL